MEGGFFYYLLLRYYDLRLAYSFDNQLDNSEQPLRVMYIKDSALTIRDIQDEQVPLSITQLKTLSRSDVDKSANLTNIYPLPFPTSDIKQCAEIFTNAWANNKISAVGLVTS